MPLQRPTAPKTSFTRSETGVKSKVLVIAGVVFLHGAALWALQGALEQREPRSLVIPAELISAFIAPPAVQAGPAPLKPPPPLPSPIVPAAAPAPSAPPTPTVRSAPQKRAVRPAPRSEPAAEPLATRNPVPDAPLVTANAAVQGPASLEAPPAPLPSPPARPTQATTPASPAPSAAPAPAPRVELPSSSAAYLNNPSPGYPSVSKRMGEQGKVLLRVLISADGRPEQIELKQSSGFDRLDRQAQETVQRWRFVPGKRGGIAEAMWYVVPINFVLE